MNNRLDIFSDKKMQLEVKNTLINEKVIEAQKEKCDDIFELWQICVRHNSWNDAECIGTFKPDYELCIRKKNLMINLFEKQKNNV